MIFKAHTNPKHPVIPEILCHSHALLGPQKAECNASTYIRILPLLRSRRFLRSHSRLTAISPKQNRERSGRDPQVPARGGGWIWSAARTGPRVWGGSGRQGASGRAAARGSGRPCRGGAVPGSALSAAAPPARAARSPRRAASAAPAPCSPSDAGCRSGSPAPSPGVAVRRSAETP